MHSELKSKALEIRKLILKSTTAAGSGHPSSSLSATDLMTALMFGGFFETDLDNPQNPNNDRLIFSKGHASPLFYALYAGLGKITEEELMTLRQFDSRLEGHPTLRFPYTEVPTGSLGQGLGVGVGMAINSKMQAGTWNPKPGEIDKELKNQNSGNLREYRTFVLMGDSEMAEGSIWEAMEIASHYELNNLIGVIDVNRLGQRGETLHGWETEKFRLKSEAFGWETQVIDGHNFEEITEAYQKLLASKIPKPKMIIAKTIKGKGLDFMENQEGWHGKAVPQDRLEEALLQLK